VTSQRFPRRLGLRARVTLVFGVGAFLLAATMAILALGLARNYLLREREASAQHQTFANALLVRSELRSSNVDITNFLATLPSGAESDSLIYRHGSWFGTSVGLGPTQLPPDLTAKALTGAAASQRFRYAGTTAIAVSVPVRAADAVYIQVFSLSELNSTLRILSASLGVAALITTAAGGLLGSWASKRALQPVRDVAMAAGEIAGGKLDTRLRATEDRELARLGAAFNAMVDAVQMRIDRDARFASDVSHELRTPLTTLATSLSVLERNTDGWTSPQRQALELMRSEMRAFHKLVEDLLEISRADAGATNLVIDDVLAAEFVSRLGAAICPTTPLDISADASSAHVSIDKRRMERAFSNLVENANRYAGGIIRVGLCRTPSGAVRFEVDDAGPGIPPSDHIRIFERFSRGSGGRRAEGSGVGLGLALVAEHVALLGGTVLVEDRPAGGSRFAIELPAHKP